MLNFVLDKRAAEWLVIGTAGLWFGFAQLARRADYETLTPYRLGYLLILIGGCALLRGIWLECRHFKHPRG